MRILNFTDSRGQFRPAGSTHAMYGERLAALPGVEVDNVLCPYKWTTTLDFLESFPADQLERYDHIVLYTGIVDWSPRRLSNARHDLYDARIEKNLGGLRLNSLDYGKKIVNCKKPTFDRVFGEAAMQAHLARPFDVAYEGEPTINMYSLEMARTALLPRLLALPRLVFVSANRFLPDWRGDYPRERPANIGLTHAYSDLFSDTLGDRVVDLRAWGPADIKRYTCDNLHLTGPGSDYIFDELRKKLGIHGARVHMTTSRNLPALTAEQSPQFTGMLAANRALREGDNDAAYAKARKLFEGSGLSIHFHTALIAATRAAKPALLQDLFAAADRLGRSEVGPDSAEGAYLRRFSFLLLHSAKRRIAELAARPRLSAAELQQLETKLGDPAALQNFIRARTEIVASRMQDEFRHVIRFPMPFPYNYLSDYAANRPSLRTRAQPRVKSVTFIYPVKNRSRRTLVSLLSLQASYRNWLASSPRPSLALEVVVVEDQGPDAIDDAALAGLPFDLRHLVVDTGVAWTRSGLINQGLAVASGEFVAFVDADVLFPEAFMSRLARMLDEVDATDAMFAFNMFETHSHVKEGQLHSAGMPYSYLWGLLRKHALAVGGFNEDFVGWGSEDRDFEHRACRKQNLRTLSSLFLPGQPYVLHLSHDVRTGSERRGANIALLQEVRSEASADALVAKPKLRVEHIRTLKHLASYNLRALKPSLADAPDARRAKTLVIMGNGPSLGPIMNDPEMLQVLRGLDTFGLNAAYRAYDRYGFYPTFFGSFDFRVCDSHAQAFAELVHGQNPIRRFFFAKQDVFDDATKAHPRFQRIGFRPAPRGVSVQTEMSRSFDRFDDCGSSGTNAVQAGYLMGYRHFILLGVDCNYVEILDGVKDLDGIRYEVVDDIKENPNYWFEGYQVKGDKFHKPNEKDIQLVSWDKLDRLLGDADGRISNCSLVSKLPMFDILPFAVCSAPVRNLFLVISCAAYGARVAALRQRFEANLRPGDRVLYVVGGADRNVLDADSVLHVTAGDFYEDLPQKVQAAIEFCVKNLEFERLIKVDDDIHIHFDNFYAALPEVARHPYLGRRTPTRPGITPSAVWHFGKVTPGSLSEDVPFKVEGPPDYWAGGGMYVIRRDAAVHLATPFAHQVAHRHLYEDFMVGDLLARHGVRAQPWGDLAEAGGSDWCITDLREIMADDLRTVRDEARMRRAVSIHCGPYPPYYRVDERQLQGLLEVFSAGDRAGVQASRAEASA